MIRLCRLDELIAGTARGFDPEEVGEDTMFVVRKGDALHAYRNRCPHQGARLEYRKDRFLSADGQRVVCYAHGAHFDLETGVCTEGICLGQSLQSVLCRIEQGWIWVDGGGSRCQQ